MSTYKEILKNISREANREPLKRLKKFQKEYKPSKEWGRYDRRKRKRILREWHGVQTGVRWVPTFTKKKPHYRKEYTYQPGDLITLRCPKGCPDIYITVKSNK